MTDYAKVRVKDVKEAYEEGCDDVKRVLRKMYPEIFESDKDITSLIEWKLESRGTTGYALGGYYKDMQIVYLNTQEKNGLRLMEEHRFLLKRQHECFNVYKKR